MHRVVGKLILEATMMPNLISFVFEMKGYVSKLKAILIRFEEKRTSYPLYFQQVYLPCNGPDDSNILREHFTFLKLKLFEV